MSSSRRGVPLDCKVYVGDLGSDARKEDLDDAFSYYGRLHNVWIARNPPGFAFVEFEDPRDAEDAVQGLDGSKISGRRVRVELSSKRRGGGGRSPRGGGRFAGGRGGRGGGRPFDISQEKCYECGEKGHFARDCRKRGGDSRRSGGGGGGSRRRSESRSMSRSRSRSYSRDRD